MKYKVGIIGGGFVGSALAEYLNKEKYEVKLSFRSNPPETQVKGVEHLYCDVSETATDASNTLFNVDSLVVCIPPGFRKDVGKSYTPKIKTIVEQAQKSGVKQLIFTSSIGIYSKDGVNDESTELDLTNPKSKVLYDAERSVLDSRLQYKQVLRLGGLLGGKRHPANFNVSLDAENAFTPVNMVMLEDVVSAIATIIDDMHIAPVAPEPILNIVSPHHPCRQSFYRHAWLKAAKPLPALVTDTQQSSGKLIDGNLICKTYGFNYQFDDFYQAF